MLNDMSLYVIVSGTLTVVSPPFCKVLQGDLWFAKMLWLVKVHVRECLLHLCRLQSLSFACKITWYDEISDQEWLRCSDVQSNQSLLCWFGGAFPSTWPWTVRSSLNGGLLCQGGCQCDDAHPCDVPFHWRHIEDELNQFLTMFWRNGAILGAS